MFKLLSLITQPSVEQRTASYVHLHETRTQSDMYTTGGMVSEPTQITHTAFEMVARRAH